MNAVSGVIGARSGITGDFRNGIVSLPGALWLIFLISVFLLCGYSGRLEADDIQLSHLTQQTANPVNVGEAITYSLTTYNVVSGNGTRIGVGIQMLVDGQPIPTGSGGVTSVDCQVDANYPNTFACNSLSEGASQSPSFTWHASTPGTHEVQFRASCQLLPAQSPPVLCASFGTAISTTTIVGQTPTAVASPLGSSVTLVAGQNDAMDVTLDGSESSDPDGTIVSYQWFENDTQIAVGVGPTVNMAAGDHTLTLRVTDNDGLSDEDSVVYHILAYPTADAGPDISVTDSDNSGSESVQLDGTASRAPGSSIVYYQWYKSDFQIATGANPTVDLAVGVHTITLLIADGHENIAEDDLVVTVLAPPTADAGQDQTLSDANGDGSEQVTLDGTASSDADGSIVSYTWSENGVEIAVGASPTVSLGVGVHNLTLRVIDDSELSDEDQVTVTILANQPPTANAGTDQSSVDLNGDNMESVTLDGTGSSDPDGSIVSYAWSENGVGIATGATPTVSLAVGVHILSLTVTDNGAATGQGQVTITVLATAEPTANAGVDQTLVDTNGDGVESVSLDGTGSADPDGSIVSYTWFEGEMTIATGASPTVSLDLGVHILTLEVIDDMDLSDVDQVTVTILANTGPTANAGVDQSVTDTNGDNVESVTLDGSGSSDPDGSIVSYAWSEDGVEIATGASPTVSLGVGVHTLALTVTDEAAATAQDQVTITVLANAVPIANAGADQSLTDTNRDGVETVTLDGTASSDPDGSIVSYAWSENGVEIATGASPTVSLAVGEHSLVLTVTDDAGASAQDQVAITVLANTAPIANAGVDQTLVDTDGNGSESVTLDGSQSSDPDGVIVSYAWSEDGNEIATGATPTLILGAGVHHLTLSVTDDTELTDQAQVTITIVDENNQLQIVSGAQLTGSSGDTVGPFTVQLLDLDGVPVVDRPIVWTITPENAATLSESESRTDQNGQASTSITIQQNGVIKLTARLANIAAVDFIINSIAGTPGLTGNQQAVGSSMDNLCPALAQKQVSGQLSAAEQDLLSTCEALISGDTSAASLLTRLAPEEVAAQGTASIKAASTQLTNIQARLVGLRRGDTGADLSGLTVKIGRFALNSRLFELAPAAGKTKRGGGAGDSAELQGPWGAFINGNINFGDKDSTDNETGYDFDTTGVTLGLDYRFSHQLVAGGAMGFSRFNSDYDDASGNLEMDAWSLSAYGTYFSNNNIYVDGLIQFGSNNYDTRRRVNAAGSPDQFGEGDTHGTQYSLNLSAGYEYQLNALTLTPYGRLSYTRANIAAYSETASDPNAPGSGSVLHIDNQAVESLVLVAGGNFSYAYSTSRALLMPQLRFEWEHEFEDDPRLIDADFVYDPTHSRFTIESDAMDKNYFNLGIGLSAVFAEGRSGYLFYEARLGQDNATHNAINAGLRIEF